MPDPAAHQGGSRLESYLLDVARGRPGVSSAILRGLMSLLAPVYCAGLELYLLPYATGIRKRTRLPFPVLSIGNLTTGGTGKTPMTQTLCRMLHARGLRVVVLSRGYGGRNEYGSAVASDGARVLLSAEEAGDEAYLLAASLPGIPVIVGKDRRVTGRMARDRFHPDVAVMDDGMQFWQLHRDLDIVLLNAREPFDNGRTFPRGLLREPPAHLRRAGIVVLTGAEGLESEELASVRRQVEALAPNRPIVTADLIPTGLDDLAGKMSHPPAWINGRSVFVVSALGNPAGFERMLGALGGRIAARVRLRDHSAISDDLLTGICRDAREAGAEAVVTTAKDAVKLNPAASTIPLLVLNVEMRIDGEAVFWSVVESVLKSP